MRPSVASLRKRAREETVRALNLVRRYSIAATSAVLWTLEGMVDADGNIETRKAELFSGVGFFSRPKAGSRAEAIVGRVGGQAGHPVILATRDQDAIKALEAGGASAEDESAMFNTLARVYVKADGSIEARTHAGVAVALAKADHKHDLPALVGATYGTIPPSGATKTGASDSNTAKLRGE